MPTEEGTRTCPDLGGGTNFFSPSYDPAQRLFFVNAREVCATFYAWRQEYVPGERFTGGAAQRARGPDQRAYGALRALEKRVVSSAVAHRLFGEGEPRLPRQPCRCPS